MTSQMDNQECAGVANILIDYYQTNTFEGRFQQGEQNGKSMIAGNQLDLNLAEQIDDENKAFKLYTSYVKQNL